MPLARRAAGELSLPVSSYARDRVFGELPLDWRTENACAKIKTKRCAGGSNVDDGGGL